MAALDDDATGGLDKAHSQKSALSERQTQEREISAEASRSRAEDIAEFIRELSARTAEQALARIKIVGGDGVAVQGQGNNWVVSVKRDVQMKKRTDDSGSTTPIVKNENGTYVLYMMPYASREVL